MKKLLLTLAVLLGPLTPAIANELVMQTAISSFTTVGVDITSQTTTSILGGTNNGWRQACVQNLSSTTAIACSENALVSTMTANVAIGTIVSPAASTSVYLTPTCFFFHANDDFFCRTFSTTGTSRVGVTRAR